MIVDSSALLAILYRETGYEQLVDRMREANFVGAGTATLAEAGIALHHRLDRRRRACSSVLLDELSVEEVAFGELHWREAVSAYQRYGKGRHPAGLNLGDCLSYASASLSGEPLLYVGNDFVLTDLETA